MTIFGTEEFDVEAIDISTLQLCLVDGLVCTDAPIDWSFADRGDPGDLGVAQCALDPTTGLELDYTLNRDGLLDLDAAFDAGEVQALLGDFCDIGAKGDVSQTLVLIGSTIADIPFKSVPQDDNTGIDRLVKVNK